MKEIVFWDLFAGIGGFHFALEKYTKQTNKKEKCVLVSEINKDSIEVYRNNFKNAKSINIQGIDDIDIPNEPTPNIIFAGFPCQPFSTAGKKQGFKDSRGTMIDRILKMMKQKKPEYLLLENVSHICTHNRGETWKSIISRIKKEGYIVSEKPLVLSPMDFNIPQNRKRAFFLIVRKDLVNENDFIKYVDTLKDTIVPKRRKIDKYLEKGNIDIMNEYKVSDRTMVALHAWNELIEKLHKKNKGKIPTLWLDWIVSKDDVPANSAGYKYIYVKKMRDFYQEKDNKKIIDAWLKKHDPFNKNWSRLERMMEFNAGEGTDSLKKCFLQLRQTGIRCRKADSFPTLVASGQVPIIFEEKFDGWRFLTTRECANIQSFPKKLRISENKTAAYKQFGNAVNVEVTYFAIKSLLNYPIWE